MIRLIVACDDNFLIGKKGTKNGMPWNNSEDLKHFKNTTINQDIVFGYNTFNAMGRVLPNRKNIIVTRKNIKIENAEVRHDLEALIKEYQDNNKDLYICGGANIYKQALPLCDELLISRIPGSYEGETYFPNFFDYGFKLFKIEEFKSFKLEIYRK